MYLESKIISRCDHPILIAGVGESFRLYTLSFETKDIIFEGTKPSFLIIQTKTIIKYMLALKGNENGDEINAAR